MLKSNVNQQMLEIYIKDQYHFWILNLVILKALIGHICACLAYKDSFTIHSKILMYSTKSHVIPKIGGFGKACQNINYKKII
jgi:hypothetical protein